MTENVKKKFCETYIFENFSLQNFELDLNPKPTVDLLKLQPKKLQNTGSRGGGRILAILLYCIWIRTGLAI